ncbi:hypothetical protein [Algoriphagus machipongonensis]|uniref:Bacteriocin-type signal sequence n=1 Tax=Algoriphagus machipongonensis TaxID=388413 RepID=A3HWV1_9BACT|nr:hypothetical protein [Algoriphagus machipongonensis]EAZ81074.1 putative bacteriocin-type signal sequence [Algoriphagus machipongonensis]
MEKFKELRLEEMQEVEGGTIFSPLLWTETIADFMIGISETYSDSFDYYRKKLKYEK